MSMKEIFGIPESKKEKKQRVIRENKRKGEVGEQIVDTRYAIMGYKSEKTGRGSDRHVRKTDILGNVVQEFDVEIKTGKSQLSPLQQKEKARKGKGFVEERVEPPPIYWKEL